MNCFFSDRAAPLEGSATREILKLCSKPGIISFAGGLPAPECLPIAEIVRISNEILTSNSVQSVLQYGSTDGMLSARSAASEYLKDFGIIDPEPDNVLMVSGGQQCIDLMCKAFLNKGDVLLVENPTYLAVLQIAASYEAHTVGVASNECGLDLSDLEDKLKRHKPKMLYIVPTFSNPTGRTYSIDNRKKIAELAGRYNCAVLEDDPYSKLRFGGEPVPSVRSMDKNGNVVFAASFSKLVAPGLRVAAVTGDREIIRKLEICKQGTDVHTSHLSQAIVAQYLREGLLSRDLARNVPIYKHKKERMIAAIKNFMPSDFEFTDPDGGLFIWGEFGRKDIDTQKTFADAVQRGVAYVAGNVFFADGGGRNTMRLNFSNSSDECIDRGIAILGEIFK